MHNPHRLSVGLTCARYGCGGRGKRVSRRYPWGTQYAQAGWTNLDGGWMAIAAGCMDDADGA